MPYDNHVFSVKIQFLDILFAYFTSRGQVDAVSPFVMISTANWVHHSQWQGFHSAEVVLSSQGRYCEIARVSHI